MRKKNDTPVFPDEMTVEHFLTRVFETQPQQKELHLDGGVVIDWTHNTVWGEMSNCHHIEVFQNGTSLFHSQMSEDCLNEGERDQLFLTIATALSQQEVSHIASLVGKVD